MHTHHHPHTCNTLYPVVTRSESKPRHLSACELAGHFHERASRGQHCKGVGGTQPGGRMNEPDNPHPVLMCQALRWVLRGQRWRKQDHLIFLLNLQEQASPRAAWLRQ